MGKRDGKGHLCGGVVTELQLVAIAVMFEALEDKMQEQKTKTV